ncbi:CvpA family protein [Patescibacteria group bacterium]|nr:CvpA family protein [Patescibacteria group bacterium]
MENIVSYLTQFIQSLNWIDIAVILIFIFYIVEGYAVGFFTALTDLISFITVFFIGLAFYSFFGRILIQFSISPGFANAIGFFIAAFLAEIIFGIVVKKIVFAKMLSNFTLETKFEKYLYSFFGIIPAMFSAFILVSFALTMILALPLSTFLKKSVTDSRLGSKTVINTQGFAQQINSVFGGAVSEGLAFFTVEPKSNESVNLNFKTNDFSVDKIAETKMLNMVNEERAKKGLGRLVFSDSLTQVGREHCEDMFRRGYFSHYSLEGLSPFDRMAQADIPFEYAGENLALAPNTDLAMQGLMDSPGHRANILGENFGKLGVGVIDGGVYGEMFCQEFTD